MQICFLKKNKLFIIFFIKKETKQLLKKRTQQRKFKTITSFTKTNCNV